MALYNAIVALSLNDNEHGLSTCDPRTPVNRRLLLRLFPSYSMKWSWC